MDIFAHALWTYAAAKFYNLRKKTHVNLNYKWTTFFGIMPDLISFIPMILLMSLSLILSGMQPSALGHPETLPLSEHYNLITVTNILYHLTHSLVVFTIVFVLVFFVFKKHVWALLGWLLHILIDIPTHSYKYYPTPAFWPISDWKFDGISWTTPWFLLLNYSMLAFVYYFIWKRHKKEKHEKIKNIEKKTKKKVKKK